MHSRSARILNHVTALVFSRGGSGQTKKQNSCDYYYPTLHASILFSDWNFLPSFTSSANFSKILARCSTDTGSAESKLRCIILPDPDANSDAVLAVAIVQNDVFERFGIYRANAEAEFTQGTENATATCLKNFH